ncbi:hypothetical protein ABZ622_18100 [Streptomyces sp. NPDC007164]|uniref:hypothetical protein n=1 Tax=Streptomyces sp. NPDC007164 TaxID=3156918 RepID=UPI0033EE9CEE
MPSTSHAILTDPEFLVPPVPDHDGSSPDGVAWLRSCVARFSSGADHRRRRALAVAELAPIAPESLRLRAAERGDGPVEVLTEALGLSADVADDVAVVAKSYQPHTAITEEADRAVARLVEACGGVADEATANRIGLLVQACDATKALVANTVAGRTGPPVPLTRRVAPDGTLVEVSLTQVPFGIGPHACPGRAHALALAAGLVDARTR